jgi:SAM-dependent methyltransferase
MVNLPAENEDFLIDAVGALEESLEYYVKRSPRNPIDYESGYHWKTIDPDGNQRDLLNEKETFLTKVSEILEELENKKPGKILDFGCGLGWILSTIDSRWEKHGLEISEFAGVHASQFAKVYVGDYLDYTESNFDVVVMNHVIEHMQNPLQTIEYIHSKLTQGGTLIIGTPDFDSAAARRYKSKFRMLHDDTHISLFSVDSMRRLLRDSGFVIKKTLFPYFETPWFNESELCKILTINQVSPPFHGSIFTIVATKV